jgi:hypothetical protein
MLQLELRSSIGIAQAIAAVSITELDQNSLNFTSLLVVLLDSHDLSNISVFIVLPIIRKRYCYCTR